MTDISAEAAFRACCYCGTEYHREKPDTELRPYGPGGAWLCFGCMTDPEHPEREEQAERVFALQLDAAEVAGGGLSILTESGPSPFDPEDLL